MGKRVPVADGGKNRSVRNANATDQKDFENLARQGSEKADLVEKMRAKIQGDGS